MNKLELLENTTKTVLSLTLISMWGFPTIKRRAFERVTATLNRFGFERKPSKLCKSLLCTDSLERTYFIT